MEKILRYLKNNKNWVDWTWFVLFTFIGILIPILMWILGLTTMDNSIIISMVSTVIEFFGTVLLLQQNRLHVIFASR